MEQNRFATESNTIPNSQLPFCILTVNLLQGDQPSVLPYNIAPHQSLSGPVSDSSGWHLLLSPWPALDRVFNQPSIKMTATVGFDVFVFLVWMHFGRAKRVASTMTMRLQVYHPLAEPQSLLDMTCHWHAACLLMCHTNKLR